MKIAVLGASGPTGRELVTQALARGHHVVALVRDLDKIADLSGSGLTKAEVDVTCPTSVVEAARGVDAIVSGLGTTKGGAPDTLTQGARAAVQSGVSRIVWLSAFGTGASAEAAGPVWPRMMKLMLGKEVGDKENADQVVLRAGGTSVHAGILTNGDIARRPRAVITSQASTGLFPGRISRATVAAAVLDQAEDSRHDGEVLVAAGSATPRGRAAHRHHAERRLRDVAPAAPAAARLAAAGGRCAGPPHDAPTPTDVDGASGSTPSLASARSPALHERHLVTLLPVMSMAGSPTCRW